MSPDEANALRPGDIVEFRGDGCYWLAKLVRQEKGSWLVTNHGKGTHASSLAQYPEQFFLVGHSDFVV